MIILRLLALEARGSLYGQNSKTAYTNSNRMMLYLSFAISNISIYQFL